MLWQLLFCLHGVRFLEVVVVLAIKEFECRHSKLTFQERWKINSQRCMHLFMKVSLVVLSFVLCSVGLCKEPLTKYIIRISLVNEIWFIYNAKDCKMWTFFTPNVCLLWFLVISVMRQLGNVQIFKTNLFCFWALCHEHGTGWAGYPTLRHLHSKLSPWLTGLPYLADRATWLGGSLHLSRKRDQDKIRNYMDRQITPRRWVTSPT